nr:MAG TPA: Receptor recognition protein, Long tail, Helical sandwich, Tail fiber [Caudoviricetes sp.]
MINVSDTFKQKLQDGERVWQEVEITFPDGTVKTVKDEIMGENCTFSDCAESSSFPIGCVVCKSMTLELDNTSDQWKNYNFYMAKVHAYLKMQTSVASPAVTDELLDENYDPIFDQSGGAILATKAATEDRVETIDKGIYTITTPEQYGEILSFTALDDMYKTNATYISHLVLPQSIETLVRDACETLGIPSEVSMAHGNLIVSEIPENMTFRQLFGWAAMLETANARLDNRGYLRFIRWDFSNVQEDYGAIADADGNITFKGGANVGSDNFISPAGNWSIDNDGFLTLIESATDTSEKLKDFFTSPTVSSDDIVITGIKLKNRENESMYGSTGYVLKLENDLVADSDLDTVAAQIGDSIIGAKFRNMSGELVYNPLIEFGDMAYTYDRKWNRYITPLTDVSCSVNGKTTVKTQADDPIRGQSKFQSESTKAIVEARRLVKKEQSAREKAVKKLEETLKNSSGLYETSVAQEDGSTITYLHDKPTLAESKNVIKFTAEAIGVSNDGGKTYPYGFFLTGDLIAKILYAHGINADYIDTGALIVRDSDGNIIFQVDMDTKKVIISGDNVVIGGSSLPDKLTKMDNNIASAKNMTFQLSNDMQTITSDADGNIPVFPTVTTTAKVMYGSNDITNDCSYTVTKSDSVTGSWDVDTHTYTVTGLSADNGWVDIKATYLINLSITKRFTISKQKKGEDGKDGEPGRTYMVEPSCNVLKRGSDKTISPNFITFKAYYRDGKSATRVPYKGRFVVEETADGNTWNTIYTSSTDEDTVTHYLYSILTNGSGQTVASSNGSTIGIPRDVTNVRCKLYASGGTTTLMDMQSVAVVIDVDNLTQSQIVEILSNDGAWKGLYYKNGQLYISFSAALGGELTLGGVNNGNGKLSIRDETGSEIGYIDHTGVNFKKGTFSGSLESADGTFTGTLSANDGNIGGWTINKEQGTICSKDNTIVLNAIENKISVNGVDLYAYGNGLVADGGFNIICGTEPFSDGTDKFQIFNLDTLSSGNYLRIHDNLVYMSSSSSKRYKILGASLPEEFIENLYNIEPIMARYKEGYLAKGDERVGVEFPMFIAEDVDKYFPLAVDHNTDGLPENWNERIMVPAMFAMLKAQKKKIDQQEKLINKLCEKLNIE